MAVAAAPCFCAYDDGMERELQALHTRQRLRGDVQHTIDTFLVACASPFLRHLILPRNNVPHYDNLPDISAYALGILDPTMDSDPELQQVLLLLRQCTPLRRRTKRAQREVQWRENSLFPMQTLVRCMQGTLLGLYPNCLKSIAFGARVGLLRFLRTLLVQPFAKLHMCMQRMPYIVKLGVMEHLCNTIYDYHPGICHTLNRSGQKVEHFCNSVSTICDIFRGELNTLYCAEDEHTPAGTTDHHAGIILRVLPRMEKIAHSYFERCTRAYRGIIVGGIQPPRSIDHARRLFPALMTATTAALLTERLLSNTHAAFSQSVFDLTHAHRIPDARHRELAWHLTQIVRVYPLPCTIALRQHRALLRRYSGDTTCISRCRILHLCMQCVLRKGSVQGTRLRHDCLTDQLVCMYCGAGTVLTIDLLGRMAHISGDNLVLSACDCACFIYFTGSGHEFSTKCGPQCISARQLYKKRDRIAPLARTTATTTTTTTAAPPSVCFICQQRNAIQQTLAFLHPPARAIVPYALCSKHTIPQHISQRIQDKSALLRFFQQKLEQQQLSSSSGSSSSSSSHHNNNNRPPSSSAMIRASRRKTTTSTTKKTR